MSRLTASFSISLTEPFLVDSEHTQRLIFKIKFDDFDAIIKFVPAELAPAQIGGEFRFCIAEISLLISKDFVEEIPNDPVGNADFFLSILTLT